MIVSGLPPAFARDSDMINKASFLFSRKAESEIEMNELKKLRTQRAKINNTINKLEKIEEARLLKDAQKYVGTCYKYYNSYGGGDNFISYFKVTKILSYWIISEKSDCRVEGVQIDDHKDNYSISKETSSLSMWQVNPISKNEFEQVYKKVLSKLA